MEKQIIKFIFALRYCNVSVSMAETIDAFHALNYTNIQEREMFRVSLRSTLIKDSKNFPIFDSLFQVYFDDIAKSSQVENYESIIKSMERYQESSFPKSGIIEDDFSHSDKHFSGMQNWLELLWNFFFEKMSGLFRFRNTDRAIDNKVLTQPTQTDTINAEFSPNEIEPQEDDDLLDTPLHMLSEPAMDELRKEIEKWAKQLRSRKSLRRKRFRKGKLDVSTTIRTNLRYGGVPFKLNYKSHKRVAKIVILWDISISMRHSQELVSIFVSNLQDIVVKTESFAFNDHLIYITPYFIGRRTEGAIAKINTELKPGHYGTDLGYSLYNFINKFIDKVDKRTTFVIIGDGRNNYNDPQLNFFKQLRDRSRRTIWINPEPPMLWGSGDSDMLKYAPICDSIIVAFTIGELIAGIKKIFE